MTRKIITMVIVVSMLLSSMLQSVSAIQQVKTYQFSDVNGHWAADNIERWSGNGLIEGYPNGTFKPNASITRAEFCALINKVFGFSKKNIESYSDVISSKGYADVASIAKAEGYTKGWADNTFEGNEPIKREEAVLALFNSFRLSSVDTEKYMSRFTDLKAYKGAAKEAIASMIADSVISGYPDKTFRPKAKISRAESIKLFDKIVSEWFNTSGSFSKSLINGNVVVNTKAVKLKDTEINGNLYLAEGIGDGDVTLNNVKVNGKTIICGGGANSIHIENSTLTDVIVDKDGGKIRVVNSGSTIHSVLFSSGGRYEAINSPGIKPVNNIVIESDTPAGQIIELSGNIESLVCNAQNVILKITSGTLVGNLTINKDAKGVELVVDGKVTNAVINASNVKVNGTLVSEGTTIPIDSTSNKPTSGSGNSGNSGGEVIQVPTGLAVNLSTYNSVSLSWVPVTGTAGYNIYRSSTIDGTYIKVNTFAVTEACYADTGLTAGAEYYYKVSAFTANSESTKSVAGFAKIPVAPAAGDWKLVWGDEFNGTPGTGVDTSKWTYEVSGDGFGNNELQYTTDKTDNMYIEQDPNDPNNRLLTIKAIKEDYQGKNYTSGRIKTEGKFDFTYGKVEMKAKLPYGNGIGCSLWMLGSNYDQVGWPNSGEIDIMEWGGKPQSRIYGTIHGPGYSAGESLGAWHEYSQGFAASYHTYAVEWEPNVISWYCDGQLYAQRTPEDISGKDWVFDHDFNIILGLGVGGDWPGSPNDSTVFPQKYTIDYVRVYQREGEVYPDLLHRELIQMKNLGTNKFVTTDKQNGDYLYANRTSAGAWETYELKEIGNNNVALISLANYKYVSVSEGNKLIANKETVGDAETFKLINNGDGTKSLQSIKNDKYVTSAAANILLASSYSIASFEKFTINQAPEAPEGLSVSSVTNSSASLDWTVTDGATGYNVYRSAASNGIYTKVNISAITENSYVDTGLTAGSSYYYKVKAVNANGESDYSVTVTAVIQTELIRPALPTQIKMDFSTVNSINLSWKAVQGITSYNVYRSATSNGTYAKVNTSALTVTSYTDTSLTAGTAYYYKVTAVNEKGESDKSGVLFTTTSEYLVSESKSYSYIIAMANSKIIESDSNNNMTPLKATASDAASDSQLFEVIYKADGNVGFASKALGQLVCADSWNVTDFQLLPRSGYSTTPGDWETYTLIPQADGTMAIKAKNGNKYVSVDSSSGILRATSSTVGINEKFIIVTPNAPTQPTGFTVTEYLDNSVSLRWEAPTASVVKGYNVYRAMTSGGEYNKVNTALVTSNSFTDTSVVASTTYKYKIAAVNARGETDSSEVTVTTRNGSLPATPTGLNIVSSTADSLSLSWNEMLDADNYNVYRCVSRFGNYEKIDTVGLVSYTALGLGYYYKVSAENENGETNLSEPVSLEMKLFGPNVYIFDPNDSPTAVQNICNEVFNQQESAETAQFGDGRYALLFKPGIYNTSVNIGYYTQVAGLGELPKDTTISGLTSKAALPDGNSTCNFWRGAENLTVNSDTKWAVAQATFLRRVKINGNLSLQDGGWASGGFIADSSITGETSAGGQQQWFTRNSDWSNWVGGQWNMVFMGMVEGKAPTGTWPDTKYTTIEKTPIIKEKPFLYIKNGQYNVFVPALGKDTQGISWSSSVMGAGKSISIADFYIAHSDTDTATTINAALGQGKHLLLTPGQYKLDAPIEVKNADTVVLGLGLASLVSANGNACMKIDDVDGVNIAGLLFDAGITKSTVLLEVGPENSSADHSVNPTTLSDLFFRVGGVGPANTDVCISINSNNVIGDHFWVWRADHGDGVTWESNYSKNGLVVNGDNVTMYGLFSEHFNEYCTLWNGNGGRTYFYQSEIAYDVPNQESWMNGTVNGFTSYKVADSVTSHEAWGLGIYSFHRDATINLNSAMEVPDNPDVKVHNVCSVMLAGNPGISHVINNTGGAVIKAGQRQEVTEYCNVGKKVSTPVITPGAGTYTTAINVTIQCSTAGATIRYTTDGSTPTETSTLYTEAINVADHATITAIAFKDGLAASDVVSATYTVDETALGRNIIRNSTYNTDTTYWDFWSGEGADGLLSVDAGKLKIYHQTSDGDQTWKTQLSQNGLSLGTGKTYVLSFDISSTIAKDISVCVESGADSNNKYLNTKVISISPETITYTFEFNTTSLDSNAKLAFLMGGGNKGSHSIYLDNVVLWEKDIAAPDQVKTPTISPASGTYNVVQTVSINCATAGATIMYTIDGSEPTQTNGAVYTGTISVWEAKTIKAIAYKEGLQDSVVRSETYTFTDNYALNKPATASSGTANLAFDGKLDTRWESASSDPQWIAVDLGQSISVSGVKIAWEGAAAKDYKIQVSNDDAVWTDPSHASWSDAYTVTDGKGAETRDITFATAVTGRYVRMYGTSRVTTYGYSIFEFEVYANKIATPEISVVGTDTEKSVTITCATEGASIRYTTDGTTPSTENGILYDGVFNLSLTSTVKAIAYKEDMNNSNVSSLIIKFNDNIALNTTASALSISGENLASNAVDGNVGSRWQSINDVDPQWITVDLGASYDIRKIIISWEAACAKDYKIQVADTNNESTVWTDIIIKTGMPSGHTMDETFITPKAGRYVRMYGMARAIGYGYSIWEFEIYGTLTK